MNLKNKYFFINKIENLQKLILNVTRKDFNNR
jgi:hypothetical protein